MLPPFMIEELKKTQDQIQRQQENRLPAVPPPSIYDREMPRQEPSPKLDYDYDRF